MIKVILWDLDNTLLDFDYGEKQGLISSLGMIGVKNVNDDMIARYAAINDSYWKRLEKGELTREQVQCNRFVEFFSKEGIEYTNIKKFNLLYQTEMSKKVKFLENSMELCKTLKNDVKQYIVTNGTRWVQETKMKISGFDSVMDGIAISEEIGAEKPNKLFFDNARKKFNIEDISLSEIMIVGDSLSSDMLGGNNAGIMCVWYNPKRKENTSEVKIDVTITRLDEVKNIVK